MASTNLKKETKGTALTKNLPQTRIISCYGDYSNCKEKIVSEVILNPSYDKNSKLFERPESSNKGLSRPYKSIGEMGNDCDQSHNFESNMPPEETKYIALSSTKNLFSNPDKPTPFRKDPSNNF